ncbi:MAG: phosphoenolpyruvate-utilizing N-terminal domain-containing protein, partial [Erysipelotrichaceae bacterium]
MLKGIAASSGIVISKVFKLEHPVMNIVKEDISDVDVEIAKLQKAIEYSCNDINIIKEKATGRLSAEELAIFDAHLMVAEDPELMSQVTDMIKNDKVNASYALEQVANMFISIFESMEDAYMRERAADIKDVTYRIKAHLLGLKLPDLSLIDEEVIVVAHDLTPSDTAQLNKKFAKGFATEIGGRTSHSAIMARSLEIPAVVGVSGILEAVKADDIIVLDAIKGEVVLSPSEAEIAEYKKQADNF